MNMIVVANRIGAKIYKLENGVKFRRFAAIQNPLGRLKDKELRFGPPGRKYFGSSARVMNREKSPHEDAARQFARKLSKALILKLRKDPLLHLTVAAEEHFSGLLKKYFKANSIVQRVRWITKDLEKVPQKYWPAIFEKDEERASG